MYVPTGMGPKGLEIWFWFGLFQSYLIDMYVPTYMGMFTYQTFQRVKD
jgi:hypothetical protein